VNFALDRPALQRVFGALSSTLTDQYLPPSMPGFRDAHIYPLNGPDLAKARSLAKGHTRSGKAVLYAPDNPLSLVRAQIVSQNLATIGIDVAVKAIPGPAFRVRVTTPGEPFDIALSFGFLADYADPSGILNLMFDGQFVGGTNDSRFDSTKYNRLLGQAALLRGRSRFRAYGDLDVRLARDAAPMVAFEVANQMTFVSKRVGCVVLRPALDLTAVCLK